MVRAKRSKNALATRTARARAAAELRAKKETTASISTKDHKLLWGRAAGRCSLCREPLTDAGTDAPRKGVTYGAMCHIVGESEKAARGKSILSLKERNSYANLILACANDHELIDKNPDKYPVELLHDLKTKHELWVSETLGATPDPALIVYSDVIDTLSIALRLDAWESFTDVVVRGMLPLNSADAATAVEVRLATVIWPEKYPDLEKASVAVGEAFLTLVRHFELFCEPANHRSFLQADHSFLRACPLEHRDYYERKEKLWEWLNVLHVCQLAHELNTFAPLVRKYVNPGFFVRTGRFMIHDSMHGLGIGPVFLFSGDDLTNRLQSVSGRWAAILKEKP